MVHSARIWYKFFLLLIIPSSQEMSSNRYEMGLRKLDHTVHVYECPESTQSLHFFSGFTYQPKIAQTCEKRCLRKGEPFLT